MTNALRRLVQRGDLTDAQAGLALDGFARLILTRYRADWPRPRMWELRHNLSAYDATYVALAEMIGAATTDPAFMIAKDPVPVRARISSDHE